jgi:diguanylate cyclase (GGDEF)-like protein
MRGSLLTTGIENLDEVMTEPSDSHARVVLPEQARELLDLPGGMLRGASIGATSESALSQIARIVGTKVVLVARKDRGWIVRAESAGGPPPPPLETFAATLDRLSAAASIVVQSWRGEHRTTWTIVTLPRPDRGPAALLLHGDWTRSESVLQRLAEKVVLAEREIPLSSEARVRVASHRLARALTRASGFADVADVAVRNAARALGADIATLAVTDAETQTLRIMATRGYPVKLVEHLRIARGDGIIGKVYETGMPLHVVDVSRFEGQRRRRTRYRTNSFAAMPIASAQEILGVLCVTDRADGRPFTRKDLSTLRTLAAPLALALGRERALAQAGFYAEAAAVDPVSGLYNRRYFHTRMQEELQRAQRQASSVGLLMIDVDDFKAVNDTYGHLVGDMVIRLIADVLRRSVRVFDICTRFGGEEFAVLMPGSGAEDAERIAERIRQRAENCTAAEPGLEALKVTVSIGLAVSRPESSPSDLIHRADLALYQAKRSGKNRVRAAPLEENGPPRSSDSGS